MVNRAVQVLIYSDQFWPAVVHPAEEKEKDLILPGSVRSEMEKLQKEFAAFRPGRTLNFKSQVGLVTLEITAGGKEQEFSVTPVQARACNHRLASFELTPHDINLHFRLLNLQ